ncbi:MAG: hypothetical protein HKN62_04060, partial [Phycisphaerales bacterium]|nr:hypothetical protein [Phycisphaerales bacterium]
MPTPLAATTRPPVFDDGGGLAEDLVCRGCGYNLRGLTVEQACPECAAPVEQSVRGDLLRFCDPAWVARLGRGIWWIMGGEIAQLVLGFGLAIWLTAAMVPGPGGTPPTGGAIFGLRHAIGSGLAMLVAIATAYGAWLFTTRDPADAEREPLLSTRRVARIGLMAKVIAAPAGTLGQSVQGAVIGTATVSLGPLIGGVVAAVGLGLVVAVGYITGLVHMRRLVKRVPRPVVARQLKVVAWGFALSQSAALLSGIILAFALPGLLAAAGTGAMPPTRALL